MSHFGKEVDKFVAAYLGANKNAREAELSHARSDYYDRLGVGMDPAKFQEFLATFQNRGKNGKGESGGGSLGEGGSIGGDVPVKDVYEAFLSAKKSDGTSLSPAQAKALTAEVGRETGFAAKNLYGFHTDAANGAQNFGFLSFQKDRLDAAKSYLQKAGLIDQKTGNAIPGADTNKAFAQFIVGEMENGKGYEPTRKEFLNNPNITPIKAAEVLGRNYIGWRIDDPKYHDSGFDRLKGTYAKLATELDGDKLQPARPAQPSDTPTKPKTAALPVQYRMPDTLQTAKPAPKANKPVGLESEFEDEEAAPAAPSAVPTRAAPKSMDYMPQEIRPKASAEAGIKPQAALEDEYLPDDNEFAAHGGVIGRSKEYPLHHVIGDAIRHVETRYGLNAANGGAIPDPNYMSQLQAVHSNAYAPSPQMMDALLARHSAEKEPIGAAMRGVYAHFANGGDVTAAREAAASILQGARQRAMDYGTKAYDASNAGDYPAAARHLVSAYGMIPDDHSLTAEVNHNGYGRGQFVNHASGQPIQELAFTPDAIRNASQNFANGSGFYPHLAYAMQQGQQPVKKFAGGGINDDSAVDTAALEDQQVAQDAALAAPAVPAPEAALPPRQISDREVDDQLTASGWKSSLQAPEEPDYIPLLPEMNAQQKAVVQDMNRHMEKSFLAEASKYKQERAQELSLARIDKREKFSADQAAIRQEENRAREERTRAEKLHLNKMKKDADYAFREYNGDTIKTYQNATRENAHQAAMDLLQSRWNQEFGDRKDTAKERDDVAINDKINHYWDEVRGIRKDTEAKRSDGSPMTDVSKKAYYDFTGLESEEKHFKNVLYSLMTDNNRTSPDAVIRVAHDMAFKHFKKGEGPQIDDKTGKIKLGGVSLFMNQDQYENLLMLRNNARAYDKQVADKATAQNQEKAAAVQRKAVATQNKADAVSMQPSPLSPDQQYAIKQGFSPDYSPEEVDSAMQRGAVQ